MIPSQYSDPSIQDRGFMKHIHHVLVDMGIYPDGGRLVEEYKVVLRENSTSTGGGGGKPRNIELYRKALGPAQDPSAGTWIRLEKWDGDGTGDYDDASASGSVAVDEKTGDVHVMLVLGKLVNGVVRFQDWEQTVKRNTFAPAIVRPVVGGTVKDPRVDGIVLQMGKLGQSITAIETALGNITNEGLAPADRAVIDRWRAFFGL